MKILKTEELEEMPFDRNGCHATGRAVLIDCGIAGVAPTWYSEYEDSEGHIEYFN